MKKNYLFYSFFVFLFIQSSIAQTPEWEWFFATESVADEEAGSGAYTTSVISDSEGNVYLNCISSHLSLTFENQAFTGSDSHLGRNFLAKFNTAGDLQWVEATDENDMIITVATASDAAGNIYTTGEFSGNYDYQGFTFDSESAALNAFLSKLDNNGSVQWTKHISVEGNAANIDEYINRYVRTTDIAIDTDGNLFVCGQMRGVNAIFDTITVPISEESDTFIAKYDSNGNILWVRTIIESAYQGHRKLACDSTGNIYLAGSHDGGLIEINGTMLGENSQSLTFLVKYSPSGDIAWYRWHGGSTSDTIFCYNITTDDNGNIYTVGYMDYPSIAFGSVTVTPTGTGQYHGFITKYDNEGVVQWAKSPGGYDNIKDVQTGNDGSVYILGNFWSSQIEFDDIILDNEGSANGYVVRMNTDGNYTWAAQIGGSGHSEWHMAVDDTNNSLYVTGLYNNARFGEQLYTAATPGEMFIAKLNFPTLETTTFNNSVQGLYPNPAMSYINLTVSTDTNYLITDTAGRIVLKGTTDKIVNISALPSGLYILKTDTGLNTKFIKE